MNNYNLREMVDIVYTQTARVMTAAVLIQNMILAPVYAANPRRSVQPAQSTAARRSSAASTDYQKSESLKARVALYSGDLERSISTLPYNQSKKEFKGQDPSVIAKAVGAYAKNKKGNPQILFRLSQKNGQTYLVRSDISSGTPKEGYLAITPAMRTILEKQTRQTVESPSTSGSDEDYSEASGPAEITYGGKRMPQATYQNQRRTEMFQAGGSGAGAGTTLSLTERVAQIRTQRAKSGVQNKGTQTPGTAAAAMQGGTETAEKSASMDDKHDKEEEDGGVSPLLIIGGVGVLAYLLTRGGDSKTAVPPPAGGGGGGGGNTTYTPSGTTGFGNPPGPGDNANVVR